MNLQISKLARYIGYGFIFLRLIGAVVAFPLPRAFDFAGIKEIKYQRKGWSPKKILTTQITTTTGIYHIINNNFCASKIFYSLFY